LEILALYSGNYSKLFSTWNTSKEKQKIIILSLEEREVLPSSSIYLFCIF